jgi:hypothetical protein
MNNIFVPRNALIAKVAGALAAEFFEAAKNTPEIDTLRKKYKNNPRLYAAANIEKWIPKATDILIGMLGMPHVSLEMKEEIWNAIQDCVNDKTNVISDEIIGLPDIDVVKILNATSKPEDKLDQMLDRALHKNLPPKAPRH